MHGNTLRVFAPLESTPENGRTSRNLRPPKVGLPLYATAWSIHPFQIREANFAVEVEEGFLRSIGAVEIVPGSHRRWDTPEELQARLHDRHGDTMPETREFFDGFIQTYRSSWQPEYSAPALIGAAMGIGRK